MGCEQLDILSWAGVQKDEVVIEDTSFLALSFLVQRAFGHIRITLTGINSNLVECWDMFHKIWSFFVYLPVYKFLCYPHN